MHQKRNQLSNRQETYLSILLLTPFIDAITGYLVLSKRVAEGSLMSPSQVFRFVLVLYFLSKLKLSRENWLALLVGLGYLVSVEVFGFLRFTQSPDGLLAGVASIFKITFGVSLFLAFTHQLRSRASVYETVLQVAILYALILLVSTAAGYNKPTYADGTFGSKGLFASGNGLSLFLGTMSGLAFLSFRERATVGTTFRALLLFAATLLVATKGSVLFAAFSLIVLIVAIPKKYRVILLAALATLGIVAIPILNSLFEVLLYRLQKSSSLLGFLASGRDNYTDMAFQLFTKDFDITRVVVGSGALQSFFPQNGTPAALRYLERDFLDLFFMYGLVGLATYLVMIGRWASVAFRARQLGVMSLMLMVSGYSLWAGHVVFDGMAITAFCFVAALCAEPGGSQ